MSRIRFAALLPLLLAPLTPSSAAAQAPPGRPDSVAARVAFVGDVLLAASVGDAIDRHDVHWPWQGTRGMWDDADLVVANLEMAITTDGEEEDKQFNFRAAPSVLEGLQSAGVDLVTLANNHSLDYGASGLLDTVEALRAIGIPFVGAGPDDETAYAPHIVEIGGARIGFLGLSRVYPYAHWVATGRRPGVASGYDYALERVLRVVDAVRPSVDALVVLVHWGSELADHPREIDLAFTDALLEHDVTAVIGHHPHVLQGMSWHDDAFVAWSLGNFVFGSFRETTRQTGVLVLDFADDGRVIEAAFRPMQIDAVRPMPPSADQRQAILRRMRTLSRFFGTVVTPAGVVTTPERILAQVPLPARLFP